MVQKDDALDSNMIKNLVKELPEQYQPVFGFPEFDNPSRGCDDRLVLLKQIHAAVFQKLGRAVRILDLGCAQGYFSLNLATEGAIVHGVDFLDKNIALCSALASHYKLEATFEAASIEDIINDLKKDQYDIVIALSVFHHLVYAHDIEYVQGIISKLASNICIGVYEMALKGEPPYWSSAQPDDPERLLNSYSFVHRLAKFPTHLSGIERPFFFASNYMWYLNSTLCSYDSVTTESHRLAKGTHQGSRYYYSSKDVIAKLSRLDVPERKCLNVREFENEISFLSTYNGRLSLPKLMLHGENDTVIWLVRERIEGRLLLDYFDDPQYCLDNDAIIEDILSFLVDLERHGLYHNDVRCWNILVRPDNHAAVIDYGSISRENADCVPPRNLFFSFLICVREISDREVSYSELVSVLEKKCGMRFPLLSLCKLPALYKNTFTTFLSHKSEELSFALLQQILADEKTKVIIPVQTGFDLLISSLEEAAYVYYGQLQGSHNNLCVAESNVISAENAAAQAKSRAAQAESAAAQAKSRAVQAENNAAQAESRAVMVDNKLSAIYSSRSWKITKPYRMLGDAIVLSKTNIKKSLKQIILKIICWVKVRPRLCNNIFKILKLFPNIEHKLSAIYYAEQATTGCGRANVAEQATTECGRANAIVMTDSAQRVFAQLKKEINKENY